LRDLISKAREQTAQAVNAGFTVLYWQVGHRIRREILKEKRAEYGAEIVSALSRQLTTEFGGGKKSERVEYLDLGRDGIHVAEYLTELPLRELLQQRLHEAVIRARARSEQTPALAKRKPKPGLR
jgi:hypothetical protein